jgi:hypothetical protein
MRGAVSKTYLRRELERGDDTHPAVKSTEAHAGVTGFLSSIATALNAAREI